MKTEAAVDLKKYSFKLFVTGMSVSSTRAIQNIKTICESYLADNYSLEIIDVHKNPMLVQKYDIIACPTLLIERPEPIKRLIGDLSDKEKILKLFNIKNT
ncbi:MAG: KaiB domain protein [Bacteroidetes bacterium]|nr:KaiB domain protein [Bacteroidota bacterium]